MRRTYRIGVCVALAAPWTACGIPQAALTSADFHGEKQSRQAFPFEVREAEELPRGFEVIGVVQDDCDSLNEASFAFQNHLCGRDFLRDRMRDKAADVGGSLLVGLTCREADEGEWSCEAQVARLQDDATTDQAKLLPENEVERHLVRLSRGDVEYAIRLEPGREKKPRTNPDEIETIEGKPANKDYLAQVGARCVKECPRELVEESILRAASEVGATRLLNLRCDDMGSGRWQCGANALD